jgi:predicted ATP-grasp superfamily ATP-dependent carboligase
VNGALVLGADYRGLGTIQSLGRHGVRVWVLHETSRGVGSFSRYAERSVHWPEGDEDAKVSFLLELADRSGLHGWVLFPTRDDTTALCACKREELAQVYTVTTPPWDVLHWAHDKRLTHQLAADAGVPFPRTWEPGPDGVEELDCSFPAILKPAVKNVASQLADDKAWRVDDRASLVTRYREALEQMPAEHLLVQELIRGDGHHQFSFAALALEGRPIASLVARRTRQYPMDFGRASTFVETIDAPEVAALGTIVIEAMGYTGLVEVEFKLDSDRDELKLLDINPRVWGWHTIGRRAGIDFSLLLWQLVHGDVPSPVVATPGVRWMWPAADVPIATREILGRRLTFRKYLRGFRGPVDFATLTRDDPIPALLELPLQAGIAVQKRLRGPARLDHVAEDERQLV